MDATRAINGGDGDVYMRRSGKYQSFLLLLNQQKPLIVYPRQDNYRLAFCKQGASDSSSLRKGETRNVVENCELVEAQDDFVC